MVVDRMHLENVGEFKTFTEIVFPFEFELKKRGEKELE